MAVGFTDIVSVNGNKNKNQFLWSKGLFDGV
jgi:hypothetical protein